MKVTSKLKKVMLLGLVVIMGVMMLQGCGLAKKSDEDILKSMKAFATVDESLAIHLNENWEVEDVGLDNWLCAANKLGTQAVIVMQFPFNSAEINVSGMDEVTALVEESYSYTGAEVEAPEVPGMENLTASEGSLSYNGTNLDGYIVYGETEYALYAFIFAANEMTDSYMQSVKISLSQFTENAPEVEDNTTVEMTDTIRWFNASYAVLTEINGWDYNRFAGLPANAESQALQVEALEEWWDVTDRATADETLDWILTEGHRTDFATNMGVLTDAGLNQVAAEERVNFMLENFEMDSTEAQFYVDMYGMYEQYGATAIDGWDYCRAMNLLSFYYLAGYYTEQEALDKSLEIAQTMQPLFDSWDDLLESYMRGYEYWAQESADERRGVYEELKGNSDNPYAVDFKMSFEKNW